MDNTEIEKMQKEIDALTETVRVLEERLTGGNTDPRFADFIRDLVFIDHDVTSGLTNSTSYNVTGGGGGSVNNIITPKTPTKYLKGYFRGSIVLIPVFVPPIS